MFIINTLSNKYRKKNFAYHPIYDHPKEPSFILGEYHTEYYFVHKHRFKNREILYANISFFLLKGSHFMVFGVKKRKIN